MERIYTYYNEQQQNLEEAKKYAASALEKLPAYVELVKFIYDGSLGLDVEIKGQSIDDAFDCIIDRNKAFIKIKHVICLIRIKRIASTKLKAKYTS